MSGVQEGFGPSGRLAQILLVEDDPEDALLMRRALERSHLALGLTWVEGGEQALRLLRRHDEYANTASPDLVLLDLNMPRMSGYDVLAEIRRDPALTQLPVVILTTSRAEEDVARGYELRANAYVGKPIGLSGFTQVLEAIEGFWFSVVIMPARA